MSSTERVTGAVGGVEYDVSYDPASGHMPAGWYAAYYVRTEDGYRDGIDDSAKIWHPTMPRRRDAVRKAERVARAYARKLSVEAPRG